MPKMITLPTPPLRGIDRIKCGRRPLQARQDAICSGSTTYQGKTCPYGHNGIRYTNNAKCVKCVSLYYKEYQTRQTTKAE